MINFALKGFTCVTHAADERYRAYVSCNTHKILKIERESELGFGNLDIINMGRY